MRWRGRAASIVVVLATAIAFVLALPHFKFTTKITDFLPDDGKNRGAQIAALLADSELSRVMVVDLSLDGKAAPEDLHALTLSFLEFLHGQRDVAFARSGFTDADVTAMFEFLQTAPATTFLPREAYSDAGTRARLTDLREQLSGPMGVMVRQTAPHDPLGGMWEPLTALRAAQGTAIIDDDGVLYTADHVHAIVFAETRSSPFDTVAQSAFRAELDGWMKRSAPPNARMQTSGTAQYAIASEAQIKGDVSRIGTISTIGMLAIFFILFGSVRMIGLGMIPMVFGSAVAMLACQAIFGEIHGITIAFGTSLLGVGLDYVEHYYAHFVLTPTVHALTTMKEVSPSLVLGALTTIIGFIGIGASGLMGLRQMAVFSMIAIVASMAATYWIVPMWMPTTYRPPRTLDVVNRAVLVVLRRLTRRTWNRNWRRAGLVLAGVVTVAGLWAARFSDDVNMLVNDSGPHVRDDHAVRERLGEESSSFAVITASSDDTLLAAIGTTCGELDQAQRAGLLASFVRLDHLLPSPAEQTARFAAAREAAPRLRSTMTELGFVPDQFQPYWDSLAAAQPKVITLADVRHSPLSPLMTAWLPAHATPIALIPLVGVKDLAAVRARVPSAAIIAPTETVVALFRSVRINTVIASAVGFAAIFLLLLARYRNVRKVLIALAPALLACAATVGTLVVAGSPLTILHVMSLLLVISLGVDFGIFFVDTMETLEEAARTMVSIITASITTILSFGLLGLSQSPGLAAIGVTVTLGVTYSLAFCFVMASLGGPRLVTRGDA
jgi:predicted exporter